MAKWARKDENNKIVEVIDFDPSGLFHESIVWEKVSDSATEEDNGLTPEINQAAKDEEARRLAELAALNITPIEE